MKTVISQRIARRMRELRQQNDLTQERLSELSGVDYKHIQLLESKNPPAAKIDTLEKISEAFDLEVWRFLKF